jgi:hypothetical protein
MTNETIKVLLMIANFGAPEGAIHVRQLRLGISYLILPFVALTHHVLQPVTLERRHRKDRPLH